jgi:hypothetical protein
MPAIGNSPGWAELMIPVQGMEISKIHISLPQKSCGPGVPNYAQDRPLALLSYHDTYVKIPCLSIMTQFLTVLQWDPLTGRLDLHVPSGTPTNIKLSLLQDFILNKIQSHQRNYIGTSDHSLTEIREMFQHILAGERFTVYLHGPNPELKVCGRVWIWNQDTWSKGAKQTSFKVGDSVRVALRLQGICFLYQGQRVRFRIQHQTIAIYHRFSASKSSQIEDLQQKVQLN